MKNNLKTKMILLISAIILYFGLKIYVSLTPTTEDDAWPDKIMHIIKDN